MPFNPEKFRPNLAPDANSIPEEKTKETPEAVIEPTQDQAQIEKSSTVSPAVETTPEDKELINEVGVINNRPKGDKTERPVFNVEGLKDKNQLTYEDVKEYVLADRRELSEVAQAVGAALGETITSHDAQKLVNGRMTQLWQNAIRAVREREKTVGNKMYDLRIERDQLQQESSQWWRKLFPAHDKLQRIEQIDHERKTLDIQDRQRPKLQSGRTYEVHETTLYRAMRYPAADAILLYTDEQGAKRALRLNKIQFDLAKRGVFYKGEPTDNRFDEKSRNMTWDQAAYPGSPLKFYQEHMSAWLQNSPEEAKKMLAELKTDIV